MLDDELRAGTYLVRDCDGVYDVVGRACEPLERLRVVELHLGRLNQRYRLPLVRIDDIVAVAILLACAIRRTHVVVHGDGRRIAIIAVLRGRGELDEVAVLLPLDLVASLHDDIVGLWRIGLRAVLLGLVAIKHATADRRAAIVGVLAFLLLEHGGHALHASVRGYLHHDTTPHESTALLIGQRLHAVTWDDTIATRKGLLV